MWFYETENDTSLKIDNEKYKTYETMYLYKTHASSNAAISTHISD